MSKPIQTPLISNGSIKELNQKLFTVCSDSLARLMWRGYDLICINIPPNRFPELDALVVVECRITGRKHCSYQVGFFLGSAGNTLTLTYNDPKLKEEIANWTIPLTQVKRIYEVDTIGRDYAKFRKFYP